MCTIKIMQKKIDLWRIKKKKAVPVAKRIHSLKKNKKNNFRGYNWGKPQEFLASTSCAS
jgi:hypothetical protein